MSGWSFCVLILSKALAVDPNTMIILSFILGDPRRKILNVFQFIQAKLSIFTINYCPSILNYQSSLLLPSAEQANPEQKLISSAVADPAER